MGYRYGINGDVGDRLVSLCGYLLMVLNELW